MSALHDINLFTIESKMEKEEEEEARKIEHFLGEMGRECTMWR